MARQPTKPTTLAPVAHQRLKEHVSALESLLESDGLPAPTLTEVLSALVIYTPAPQLAGMLAAWRRYNDERAEADAQGKPPPAPPRWG
jgi:hypothetical protein